MLPLLFWQFIPENPEVHVQVYWLLLEVDEHIPPFWQGLADWQILVLILHLVPVQPELHKQKKLFGAVEWQDPFIHKSAGQLVEGALVVPDDGFKLNSHLTP